MPKMQPTDLRSRQWFNNPENREMTALYLERYLNYGLTREELQSNKPIQTLYRQKECLMHLKMAWRV